jgi:guanylate kinase
MEYLDKITSMVRRKEIPGSKKGKEYFFPKSETLKSLKKF